MKLPRVFPSADFMQPSPEEDEPIRSLVSASDECVVIAWHVKPGQRILPHIHPKGQDTWTILSGRGTYTLDKSGTKQAIHAGDVVIARTGEVHGVVNNGSEPLCFISVVTPAEAGFELVG